ncbi:MAG: hypothetical protein ACXVRH_05120 [Thermoleophilaceae bacterium]
MKLSTACAWRLLGEAIWIAFTASNSGTIPQIVASGCVLWLCRRSRYQ